MAEMHFTPSQQDAIFSRGGTVLVSAAAEDLGRLARHMEDTLLELTREMHRGEIPARPIYRSAADNACTFCDFAHVCHFSPGERGDCHRVLTPLLPEEVWSRLKAKGDEELG